MGKKKISISAILSRLLVIIPTLHSDDYTQRKIYATHKLVLGPLMALSRS